MRGYLIIASFIKLMLHDNKTLDHSFQKSVLKYTSSRNPVG